MLSGRAAADYLETKDGAKIYYEDHGEGQPIVLVHGWMCSSRFWQKNVPGLANEFRVVTPDLRGHGNSSKVLTGHTIKQYARDIRELIEDLALQNIVLVGWSLGGPVVLSYYEQYPKDRHLKIAPGIAMPGPKIRVVHCLPTGQLRGHVQYPAAVEGSSET